VDLVINFKAAKALGIELPMSFPPVTHHVIR
jgi:hypothetical protein